MQDQYQLLTEDGEPIIKQLKRLQVDIHDLQVVITKQKLEIQDHQITNQRIYKQNVRYQEIADEAKKELAIAQQKHTMQVKQYELDLQQKQEQINLLNRNIEQYKSIIRQSNTDYEKTLTKIKSRNDTTEQNLLDKIDTQQKQINDLKQAQFDNKDSTVKQISTMVEEIKYQKRNVKSLQRKLHIVEEQLKLKEKQNDQLKQYIEYENITRTTPRVFPFAVQDASKIDLRDTLDSDQLETMFTINHKEETKLSDLSDNENDVQNSNILKFINPEEQHQDSLFNTKKSIHHEKRTLRNGMIVDESIHEYVSTLEHKEDLLKEMIEENNKLRQREQYLERELKLLQKKKADECNNEKHQQLQTINQQLELDVKMLKQQVQRYESGQRLAPLSSRSANKGMKQQQLALQQDYDQYAQPSYSPLRSTKERGASAVMFSHTNRHGNPDIDKQLKQAKQQLFEQIQKQSQQFPPRIMAPWPPKKGQTICKSLDEQMKSLIIEPLKTNK